MADLHRALHLPLELYRGVTRRVRGSNFNKAAGVDTVLGRPTATLAKGTAVNYTGYDTLIASVARIGASAAVANIPCEWETLNPAVWIVVPTAAIIEDLFEAQAAGSGGFEWALKARASTIDEILIAKGPVYLIETGLRPSSAAATIST